MYDEQVKLARYLGAHMYDEQVKLARYFRPICMMSKSSWPVTSGPYV